MIKAQVQFSIAEHFTNVGTFLDGTECKILVDCGTSKSFMSKQYCLRKKSLHGLPKISSKGNVIQVGNGESVNILFIISIIITFQGHILKFI